MTHAAKSFLRKYIFSLDHKMIGMQYYALALVAVFVGMFLSWLMRFHLVWPNAAIPGLALLSKAGAPGGVMSPEFYLSVLTMHGTLMIFFVLTNAPFAAFGNYFLPLQIGAEKMAFPRCSMISFWTTFTAFVVLLSSFVVPDGPPISGWTAYAPFSAVGRDAGPGMGMGQNLWLVSIAIFCIGSILTSLNFIATTLDLRAQGMTLIRMPLTVWAWFITACISLLAFAVLLPACVLLLLDRVAGTSFFIPAGLLINDHLQAHAGGSPLLWQHLFWFFGHPEVYIAILPAMGIVSHILINSTGRPLVSTKIVVAAMAAIGFLSFILWGHHMFVSGMNPFSALAFSVPTLVITIPATLITLIWIASLYGARLQITSASLFALGFISVFVSGGVSGFFLAQPATDMYLHATYFVVGHFHLIMGVAAIFGIFAGTYFWMPKMSGRLMSETLGKLHFWLTFVGAYCIFMPFYYLGLAGNVRRYSSFVNDFMAPLMPVHKFITIAAFCTGAAQSIFLYNLVHSCFRGPRSTDNPWHGTSLESSTPQNFDESKNATTLATSASDPSITGVWLVIAAIVMFFTALTSALIIRQGSDNNWQHILIPRIIYLNAALLIASSLTLVVGQRRLRSNDGRVTSSGARVTPWVVATSVLGVMFLIGQYVGCLEIRSNGLFVATNAGTSFFYVLTAAYALLFFCGLLALLRAVYVVRAPAFEQQTSSLRAASLYWYFMTLLWIYLCFVFWRL